MRAAIYARYSSENQRDESIEDQIEVCRRYAARLGFEVTATFNDRAISGSNNNRPRYQQMLAEARRGSFDVVIVEAVDRLARKLADIAGVHDELSFHRASLHAVNVGAITTMHVGMLGTMAQIFLSDLRSKTKRGQLGRVLQGKSAAGKAFGYDVIEGVERGGRTINQGEAKIVERIFSMFASGVSPRAIARRLNEEGVPGSGGASVAGHHHSRPKGTRHRPFEQRALCRRHGLEPLLLREGPAHRQARRKAEPCVAMGAHAGA